MPCSRCLLRGWAFWTNDKRSRFRLVGCQVEGAKWRGRTADGGGPGSRPVPCPPPERVSWLGSPCPASFFPGSRCSSCAPACACSPKRLGMSRMADALSSTAASFSRDDDPDFVRTAAPSTLKMVEMLLDEQPAHHGLLVTACGGFTQYAYGFLQADADRLTGSAATEMRRRAQRMYERARYCQRALDVRHPGFAGLTRRRLSDAGQSRQSGRAGALLGRRRQRRRAFPFRHVADADRSTRHRPRHADAGALLDEPGNEARSTRR